MGSRYPYHCISFLRWFKGGKLLVGGVNFIPAFDIKPIMKNYLKNKLVFHRHSFNLCGFFINKIKKQHKSKEYHI